MSNHFEYSEGTERQVNRVTGDVKRRTYTVQDVKKIMYISKNSAYELVKSGKFPVQKVGGMYRIPIDSFERWLSESQPS